MSDQYRPPPGPPPGYTGQLASNNPFRNNQQRNDEELPSYQPPAGPPPSRSDKKPSQNDEAYLPPPGPPPGQSSSKTSEFQTPPGPPPGHGASSEPEPPPYDPWMAVPDSTLLPPPPSFKQDFSPTANAEWGDAARGHAWIDMNPLWQPRQHDQQTLTRISHGDVRLTMPPGTQNVAMNQGGIGRTNVRTNSRCQDTIFLSDIPVFASEQHSPMVTEKPRITYYELEVKSMGNNVAGSGDAGIAIGFLAPPYPSWRLPGWHRASLGVHGDDGRRYVDDSDGGRDFVESFRRGDVVGIGIVHSLPMYAGGKPRCEVFFTRNGVQEGKWDLHEETDQQQEGGDVRGLEGQHDLLAAVGCFGAVDFEVRFKPEEWRFRL